MRVIVAIIAAVFGAEQAITVGAYRSLPVAQLLPTRPSTAALVLRVQCSAWLAENAEFASQSLCALGELRGSFEEMRAALSAARLRLRRAFSRSTRQTMRFRLEGDGDAVSDVELVLECFGEISLSTRSGEPAASVDAAFARWFDPSNFAVEFNPPRPGLSAFFRGADLFLAADYPPPLAGVALRVRDPVSGLSSAPTTVGWTAAPPRPSPVARIAQSLSIALLATAAVLSLSFAVRRLVARRRAQKADGAEREALNGEATSDAVLRWNKEFVARRAERKAANFPTILPICDDFDNLSAIAFDDTQLSEQCSVAEAFDS